MKRHGLEGTRQYRSWRAMKDRCLNAKGRAYKDYGARGITVCERWLSFDNFWADMGATYEPHLTLERRDNNGPYCAANCRWATRQEQCNNRRSSRLLIALGRTRTLGEWATISGLKLGTIWMRLKRGMPAEDAIDPVIRGYPRPRRVA